MTGLLGLLSDAEAGTWWRRKGKTEPYHHGSGPNNPDLPNVHFVAGKLGKDVVRFIKAQNDATANDLLKGGGYYDLAGLALQGQDLSGSKLLGMNLSNSNLDGANMKGVFARGVQILGANMRNVHWQKGKLRDVSIKDSNLEGMNTEKSKIKNLDLHWSNLTNVKWGDDIAEYTMTGGYRLKDRNGRLTKELFASRWLPPILWSRIVGVEKIGKYEHTVIPEADFLAYEKAKNGDIQARRDLERKWEEEQKKDEARYQRGDLSSEEKEIFLTRRKWKEIWEKEKVESHRSGKGLAGLYRSNIFLHDKWIAVGALP